MIDAALDHASDVLWRVLHHEVLAPGNVRAISRCGRRSSTVLRVCACELAAGFRDSLYTQRKTEGVGDLLVSLGRDLYAICIIPTPVQFAARAFGAVRKSLASAASTLCAEDGGAACVRPRGRHYSSGRRAIVCVRAADQTSLQRSLAAPLNAAFSRRVSCPSWPILTSLPV